VREEDVEGGGNGRGHGLISISEQSKYKECDLFFLLKQSRRDR